jgi:DNA-binding IclR family transcriptional regulator
MRMLPLVGVVAPAHATASGKAWLARLPEREAVAVLDRHGMPQLAPRTITSRRRLLAELRAVRARGWAVVDEELAEGGRAIAAPIVCGGQVVGAVAVSGPTFRLSLPKLYALGPRMLRAAADLGAVWPLQVAARDFGLGAQPQARANGHGRSGAGRRR